MTEQTTEEPQLRAKLGIWTNPGFWAITGFVLGMLTILVFLYLPSQRLLQQREQAITDLAKFNREEQERIRELRDVSTGEIMKWIAISEKTNTNFQRIQQSLVEQERQLSNPGWFYISAMMIIIVVAFIVYLLVNKNANVRDTATLENFETFVTGRIEAIHERRELVNSDQQQRVNRI